MSTEVPVGERRQQTRYACDLVALCGLVMSNELAGWQGRVLDISRGGLRITVPRRLEPGAILQVRLSRHSRGAETPLLLARVAHVRRHDNGEWLAGCHLAQEL